VHATHPTYIPEENSPLRGQKNVTWDQKVRIVMNTKPEISCSAIKPGDGRYMFWSHAGVVLSGGTIKYASVSDGGTQVNKEGKRTFNNNGDSLGQQVSQTFNSEYGHYNEFVVADPHVAGLFIVSSDPEDKTLHYDDIVSYDELIKMAEEFNLPAYVFYKGELYELKQEEIEVEVRRSYYYQDKEPEEGKYETYHKITSQQRKELYDQGYILNDKVVISDNASSGFENKKVRLKVFKMDKKADIYKEEDKDD